MYEPIVGMSKVVALALWAIVALLMLAAWATWVAGVPDGVSYLLGFTACSTSAAAATAHVRLYSVDVCEVIRATRGRPDEPGPRRLD